MIIAIQIQFRGVSVKSQRDVIMVENENNQISSKFRRNVTMSRFLKTSSSIPMQIQRIPINQCGHFTHFLLNYPKVRFFLR